MLISTYLIGISHNFFIVVIFIDMIYDIIIFNPTVDFVTSNIELRIAKYQIGLGNNARLQMIFFLHKPHIIPV